MVSAHCIITALLARSHLLFPNAQVVHTLPIVALCPSQTACRAHQESTAISEQDLKIVQQATTVLKERRTSTNSRARQDTGMTRLMSSQ